MAPRSPFFDKAKQYAIQAVAGEIVVGRLARFACERFLRDLESQHDEAWPYFLDETIECDGDRFCRFFEKLPHVKGDWARRGMNGEVQLLKAEPWQCFIFVNVFGWKDKKTLLRRFVEATIYISRKNSKSMMAAGIGWWMFGKDGEPGAEVYPGATTEKQAFEVFKPAKMMTTKIPALREQLGVTVRAKSMTTEDGSKFEPVVGTPTDGASPHCAIMDEYHEHKTNGLRDAMRTGMGARKQPLLLTISTAGFNIEGPCYAHWKDCEKLLEGAYVDERHFVIIYCADDPEQWFTETEIRKANPNLGVSVYLEKILRDVENAKRSPIDQTTVKTKVLNLWVRSKVALFNVEIWMKPEDKGGCFRAGLKREDFAGIPFVCGLDLAFQSDLSSLSTIYQRDGKFYVFGDHFHHMEYVTQPENAHFARWARDGWLHVNDGNVIDLTRIYEKIDTAHATSNLQHLVYDPAHSQTIIQPLMDKGVPCVKLTAHAQTAGRMPEWIVAFDAHYRRGAVIHDGNPLTAWSLGNCVGKRAQAGLVYLSKPTDERLKIDPITAMIMAFGLSLTVPTVPAPSFNFV